MQLFTQKIEKTSWIILVLSILVVLEAGLLIRMYAGQGNQGKNNQDTLPDRTDTRAAIDQKKIYEVPSQQQSGVPADIAVPTLVVERVNGSSIRTFSVTVGPDGFKPTTIIAKQNDSVVLKVTASQSGYDVTQPDFGFKRVVLPAGREKVITLDATATGEFVFFCDECRIDGRTVEGHLIIAPR
jgi:heme/copper-type cytochrome/quinol oxidase subunit 2